MELAAGGPAGDEVMVPAPVVPEERTGTPRLPPPPGCPWGLHARHISKTTIENCFKMVKGGSLSSFDS